MRGTSLCLLNFRIPPDDWPAKQRLKLKKIQLRLNTDQLVNKGTSIIISDGMNRYFIK